MILLGLSLEPLDTKIKTLTIKSRSVWYATRVFKRKQSPLQFTNLFHFIIAPTFRKYSCE